MKQHPQKAFFSATQQGISGSQQILGSSQHLFAGLNRGGFFCAVMSTKQFTEREKAIIRLAARGLITQEIAFRLYLSLDTVELYMRNIVKKLNARSVNQCIAEAVRMNLL